MPKYQRAKPFDIIQTIKDMQGNIKTLQLINPGSGNVWQEVSYLNSWAGVTGDGLLWRLTNDRCVHVAGRATVPAGYTAGQQVGTVGFGTSFRTEYAPVVFYSTSSTESASMIALTTAGGLFAYGAMASTNTWVVNVRFPLDGPALP